MVKINRNSLGQFKRSLERFFHVACNIVQVTDKKTKLVHNVAEKGNTYHVTVPQNRPLSDLATA